MTQTPKKTLAALLADDAPQPQGRNLITVASGKGGVGKTWFAVTLAQALGRLGRHVLAFDGDLGLANIDIQLGLTPERDLGSVLADGLPLQQAVTAYADPGRSGAGFDVIAGASGSGTLAALSPKALLELREQILALAPSYDHVVLDLGAGVDMSVATLSRHDGVIVVVISGDPTSLTDAYALIKLTHLRQPNADIRVVVNGAANAREADRIYGALKNACRNFLQISPPLLGAVRHDAKVRETIRAQQPLLTRFPTCDAALDVETIAKILVNENKAGGRR